MAFKFIESSSTGFHQTIFNRTIEDPETIDLTSDTPGALSNQSIPFDGIDDSITFTNYVNVGAIGTSGASATNVAIDAWIKHDTSTGVSRATFFDMVLARDISANTSGYDGDYIVSAILTGGNQFIEFRISHDQVEEYVLTSSTQITTTAWHHIYCDFASGSQTMRIFIDRVLDSSSTLTEVVTGSPLGERGINFGGRLDEMRMWIATGSASSIGQIGAVSAIGSAPEDLNPPLNDFQPTADTLAAWWRFESVSAVQLFSAIAGSILDSSTNGITGTPSGFTGSDNVSSELTIIDGISASGDLKSLEGGSLDHGALVAIDPTDNTLILEIGSENLIDESFDAWTSSGTGVVITLDSNNIFYGSSGVKINTASNGQGAYQDISNSALLFNNNTYTMSLRYRSVSGSTSARFNFILGDNTATVTGITDTSTWKPIIVRNTLTGTATGRVEIIQLDAGAGAGALFHIDGLQVIEGDYPSAFIAHSRIRKSGQLFWPVLD